MLFIGSDHAGYKLKLALTKYLIDKGYEVEDVGCYSEESCDYPVYGIKVAEKAVENNTIGIAVCGSGAGICMAANKVHKARAVNVNNKDLASLSRHHNDANVICFGSRLISEEEAKEYLDIFLSTVFDGDRHIRRKEILDNRGF